MKLCLDTNAYSAFKRGEKSLVSILENADEILIPATVLGELYSGFRMGSLAEKNIQELELFLSKPGIGVQEINKDISMRYGFIVKALRDKGSPIPTNDIWIAAAAMNEGLILLSRDKHFKEVPGLLVMDF